MHPYSLLSIKRRIWTEEELLCLLDASCWEQGTLVITNLPADLSQALKLSAHLHDKHIYGNGCSYADYFYLATDLLLNFTLLTNTIFTSSTREVKHAVLILAKAYTEIYEKETYGTNYSWLK